MWKYLFVVGLTAMVYTGQAQIINIDKTDTSAYSKKSKLEGNLAAGLEVDKQQTTLYDASNFLDLLYQQWKELLILSCSERFTYNGPQDFLNTGYFHLRWRHDYKDKIHPETYIQYQWDSKLGIRHRVVGGANLRYNFWHHRLWEMTFATGMFYENERWDYDGVDTNKIPAYAPDIKTSVVKSNSYIKWEGKVSSASTLATSVFYQARFDNFLKPRIAINVSFDVEISKHFTLGMKYGGIYDCSPLVPINKYYYTLFNNIGYKF